MALTKNGNNKFNDQLSTTVFTQNNKKFDDSRSK